MRFLFFYLMTDDPDRVRRVAAQHSAYWEQQALAGYLGGPFADRSGGLITFEANTPALAEKLVSGDPFLRQGCISSWWLKEWLAEDVVCATQRQMTDDRPRRPAAANRPDDHGHRRDRRHRLSDRPDARR